MIDIIELNYAEIEKRVLANQTDFHKETASEIFKVPYEKVSDYQRRIGKLLNFGLMYGALK